MFDAFYVVVRFFSSEFRAQIRRPCTDSDMVADPDMVADLFGSGL